MNRVRRFTTLRWLVGLLTALALLFSAPATAGADSHGHGSRHEPDRIDLPNGWQPEGITTDGKNLYVGSLVERRHLAGECEDRRGAGAGAGCAGTRSGRSRLRQGSRRDLGSGGRYGRTSWCSTRTPAGC